MIVYAIYTGTVALQGLWEGWRAVGWAGEPWERLLIEYLLPDTWTSQSYLWPSRVSFGQLRSLCGDRVGGTTVIYEGWVSIVGIN